MQKGYKHKKETILKMRKSAKERDNTNRLKALPKGGKHWNWKEEPTVLTLHKRIHRKFGKASNHKCSRCDKQARDWALIGKKYTYNIKDYTAMCRKCHINFDKSWLKRKPEVYIRKRNIKGEFIKS